MYKIMVNNTDIIKYANNIAWNSDMDTLGTQLNFDSFKEIIPGTVASLYNDDLEIFRGIALKPTKKRWIYSYVFQDYSFYLKNKVIKQFNNARADDAIKSLANEFYVTVDIVDIPTVINQTYHSKTVSEIIDDILKQAESDQGVTYFKEIEGNILYIRKLTDMIITPQILLPKDIDIEMSMENMKNRIEVVSNSEKNNSIYAIAEDTSQQGFYGILIDQKTVDDKNISQAQNIANNALASANKIEYQSTFEVIAISGGDTIKANRMIPLKSGTRLDGNYRIKTANHTLTKGMHKVNLTIIW